IGEFITLERHLSGGNLMLHSGKFADREEEKGEIIAPKRSGMSKAKDATEVLFKFADRVFELDEELRVRLCLIDALVELIGSKHVVEQMDEVAFASI
ncbi:hypothetical protein, partial [Mesorhizobium sp. M3A.F.Ca.ET.174.01.1.1]|uniref:hypothetical protein n=1 Tax=Mesorhizobium sp. M3A.F.Ca.ET.174.01.1.1 TaxID=2563944 RepID=UPI001679FD09